MTYKTINFTANEQDLINTSGELQFASDTVSYIKAVFSLDENWSGFDSVRAVWKSKSHIVAMVLDSNDSCNVPVEVLTEEGRVRVNLVGSTVDDDTVTDRLTTYQVIALNVLQKVNLDGDESQAITPSQYEQFVEAVAEDAATATAEADRAKNDADRAETAADEVADLMEDFEGVTADATTLQPGTSATVSYDGGHFAFGIPRGSKGDPGNGIDSIVKTGTSGNVDTYTITFDNGNTTTFTVTNGDAETGLSVIDGKVCITYEE